MNFAFSRLRRRLAQYEQERAMERAHLEQISAKRQAETDVRLRQEHVSRIISRVSTRVFSSPFLRNANFKLIEV